MPLPPDFDIYDHVIGEGTGLPQGVRGVNPSGRWGNHFVKQVDSPEHVVEPGISHFLTVAGVDHPPVSYAHRNGDHYVVTPWTDGKRLGQLRPEDLDHPGASKDRALHILTNEWLAGVADRHGGNYLFHPERGLMPIDFGLTAASPKQGWGTMFLHPHQELHHSDLLALARRHLGLRPSDPIPKDTVARIRDNARELRHRYSLALSGYSPWHAEDHQKEFDRRLKHLLDPKAGPPTAARLLEFS